MRTEEEEYKLIYRQAKQAINDINNKIETLNAQREYQKGLRDAAYAILNMMEKTEKGEEG